LQECRRVLVIYVKIKQRGKVWEKSKLESVFVNWGTRRPHGRESVCYEFPGGRKTV